MSINFATLQGLTIPEGAVTQIADAAGNVLWAVQSNLPVILEVEKITSDTYAGETLYSGEQFILLDIYPKTNGTVSVTYGGLTKTITDTSGAEEPNAQEVFFGTFNGVSDEVETPASGTLTIEGDCLGFGHGGFTYESKLGTVVRCPCITEVKDFGIVENIPDYAFNSFSYENAIFTGLTGELVIASKVKNIGANAFAWCPITKATISGKVLSIGASAFFACKNLRTIEMLGTTPPELVPTTSSTDGSISYENLGTIGNANFALEQIIVPKGCAEAYKAVEGWSTYADYIVEAS